MYYTNTLTANPILEHGSSEFGYSYQVLRNETGTIVGNFIQGYNRVYFFDALAGMFRLDELCDLATLLQWINDK